MPQGWTPVDETPKGWTPVDETKGSPLSTAPPTALGVNPATPSLQGIGSNIRQGISNLFDPQAAPSGSNVDARILKSAAGTIKNFIPATIGAFTNPPSQEEQQKYPGLTAPGLAVNRLMIEPAVNAVKWYRDAFQGKIPDPVGQALSVAPEALGVGIGNVAAGKMTEATGEAATYGGLAGYYQWKGGLLAITHDVLNKASKVAMRMLSDSRARVGERVGGLQNDIAATDLTRSQGEPSIPVSDIMPKIDELANKYKAPDMSHVPKFAAAAKVIADRTADGMTGNLTFKELSDVRTEVSDLWSSAKKGSRDRAAANELRDMITQKLSDRAAEIGHAKTFEDFNGLWRTQRAYDEGLFGKLLNADDGKEFFNNASSKANRAEMERTVNSLKDFGLPADFMDRVKAHNPALEYVNSADKGFGYGKLRAIARHPVVGTAGFVGGHAVGGFLGGIGGAIGAGSLVDTIRAAKYIREQGGMPSRVGEMEQYSGSIPTGAAPPPTTPINPGLVNDLASALQNQGVKKAQAIGAARIGARQFPNPDDFSKAYNAAWEAARGNFGSRAASPAEVVNPATQTLASPKQWAADFEREFGKAPTERDWQVYQETHGPTGDYIPGQRSVPGNKTIDAATKATNIKDIKRLK